ncbi:bifunctional homocysteine S-methyltransferase/methylenetetrahydrofolate reductase [Ferdinandcohnia sp. Marseille-Q9671]
MSLLKKFETQIVIGDGAMGTLLYSYGAGSCFEELNLSQPEQIQNIHRAYIEAGADVIQTNTYAANYLKLGRYGLEDSVKSINSAAVRHAKKALQAQNENSNQYQKQVYVLGTLGGNRGVKASSIKLDEIKRSFREQLYCLLLEGVDGLILETFWDLEELETVLTIARKETKLPIIAQVSHQEPGILQESTPVNEAIKRLEGLGADVVGLNCRLGPHHMLTALEQIELPKHAYLSAYPNASLPAYTDGKFYYGGDADYFERAALEFRKQGVRLLGGCCGTTPEHIRAFATSLLNCPPITEKTVKATPTQVVVSDFAGKRSFPPLQEIVKERPSVIVELDPPRKLDTTKFFEGARALKNAGIDAVTLADNSLAQVRIANDSLGYLLKRDSGMRPLIHIACRDRNLIGLQSHLMGLHTLGLHDVLAITGDPARVGDFPGASSVYDMASFELIQMIKQLNQGLSYSGKDLGARTAFSIAGAFNPNVKSLENAVKRLEKKVACGADYFISQPVFSEERLLEIYEHTKHLEAPIYIGLMPLLNSKNAEFLHNEVPGIKIADSIRERMAFLQNDPVQSAAEGIEITKSLIDATLDLFNGIYLITPFLRYELTVELAQYARQRAKDIRGNNYAKTTN